jgi:small subunit ribosomal protein S4
MRYTGPKNRIARREGLDLGMKTPGSKSHATLLKKINVPPGQHGLKGKRKVSEHARQLREKQKLRYIFGVTETQQKNYFKTATKKKGNTGILLSELLERRLDAVIYRLGFAPTMASARQLIVHKHINVNDRILNVPSYMVKVGDVVNFAKETSTKIPYIETVLARKDAVIAPWLEVKANKGKLIAIPTSEIIEKQINLRLVVEFYSR